MHHVLDKSAKSFPQKTKENLRKRPKKKHHLRRKSFNKLRYVSLASFATTIAVATATGATAWVEVLIGRLPDVENLA